MGLGLTEIKFVDLDPKHNSVVAPTPEIMELLRTAKIDTTGVNEIHCPIGASNHTRAKFVVHRKVLKQLIELENAFGPTPGDEGESSGDQTQSKITFSRTASPIHMTLTSSSAPEIGHPLSFGFWMLSPVPLLPGAGSWEGGDGFHGEGIGGDLFLIELVDERYYWQFDSITALKVVNNEDEPNVFMHGINITDPDNRDDFLVQSMKDPAGTPTAWLGIDVLEALIDWKDPELGFDLDNWFFWNPLPSDDRLRQPGRIRDYHFTGQSVGQVIDDILTMHGMILATSDQSGGSDTGLVRFVTVRAGDPQIQGGIYKRRAGHLLTGGYSPGSSEIGSAPEEAMAYEAPSAVSVHFPKSVLNQGYKDNKTREDMTNHPGDDANLGRLNFTTDRWFSIDSTEGKPEESKTSPLKKAIYSNEWARYERTVDPETEEETVTLLNRAQLETQADQLSKMYYDRFKVTLHNGEWSGFKSFFFIYAAGTQEVIWSIGPEGPRTIVRSSYHHPLFGFLDDQPLKQSDIQSIGDTRSFLRGTGGVLLDGRSSNLIDLYMGEITEVFGPDQGWEIPGYSATAYSKPDVTVNNMVPERVHDPSVVDINPVEVGAPCIIGVIPPGGLGGEGNRSSRSSTAVQLNKHDYGPNQPLADLPSILPEGQASGYSSGESMIRRLLNEISPVESSGVVRSYSVSPGTTAMSRTRQRRSRGGDPTKPDYVLFVWETPKTVQCTASEPAGAGSAASNITGFYGSPIARMHGY